VNRNVRPPRLVLGGILIAIAIAGANACQLVFPFGPVSDTADGASDGSADTTNQGDAPSDGRSGDAIGPDGGISCDASCTAETLVPSLNQPAGLHVGNGNVYWTTFSNDSMAGLWCKPVGGGQPQSLAPGFPYVADFVVDSNGAYIAAPAANHEIAAYAFGPGTCGSGGQSFTFSNDPGAQALAIDDARLYWYHQDNVDHTIYALPKDAGADAEAGVTYSFQFGYGSAVAMTTYGGQLYFTIGYPAAADGGATPGQIGYQSVAGAEAGAVSNFASGGIQPAAIAVDASGTYWVHAGDRDNSGSVMMYGSHANQAALVADMQASPMGIYVDDNYVYWTNRGTSANGYNDGSVMRALKAGPGKPTTLAQGEPQPMGIGGDGANIYWVDCGAGNDCFSYMVQNNLGKLMTLPTCHCP
jgi:hypothetical protein